MHHKRGKDDKGDKNGIIPNGWAVARALCHRGVTNGGFQGLWGLCGWAQAAALTEY